METPEAATRLAEASDMGDTHAVRETATPKMGDITPQSAKPSLPTRVAWRFLVL
jgi:hypothetical protein